MMDLLSLLPPFWKDDPALTKLQSAICVAVADYLSDVDALLHSGAVSTARDPFIRQWESLYGTQQKDGTELRDRRSAVMAKMRTGGICSPEKLKSVAASFYGGEVEIAERTPDENTVTVKFVGQQSTPTFLSDLSAALASVLPAHLSIQYAWEYLLVENVHGMTLQALESNTLDKFAGG
ncbi:MAG: DUF2313 domain-containing protein [Oscillospiraceae bacterium]|nr:DUF2313 domain-containing protein [Oscillospiraceae bacterium]